MDPFVSEDIIAQLERRFDAIRDLASQANTLSSLAEAKVENLLIELQPFFALREATRDLCSFPLERFEPDFGLRWGVYRKWKRVGRDRGRLWTVELERWKHQIVLSETGELLVFNKPEGSHGSSWGQFQDWREALSPVTAARVLLRAHAELTDWEALTKARLELLTEQFSVK